MAGRALAFSDPRVVELIKTHFIPVAADDWYQRRRTDQTGLFFRSIVDQIRPQPDPKASLQGLYIFTATGQLLGHRNSAKHVNLTQRVIEKALSRWNALGPFQTQPNSIAIPDLPTSVPNHRYAPEPPANATILRVVSRALDHDPNGHLIAWQHDNPARGTHPAYDHVWLLPQEINSIVELADSQKSFEIPVSVTNRLARFHLVDNTRGEPKHWKADELESVTLVAERQLNNSRQVKLELRGKFSLRDPESDIGYIGAWQGILEIDRSSRKVTQFNLFALGEHWGEGRWTPGARPGRTPLGIAIRLADGNGLGDKVPPQAFRSPKRYFNTQEGP